MNELQETNKLLAKILFELKDLRAELARRAGEPVPEKPKAKPWTGSHAVSVRTMFGRVVETESADLPSAITPEMRRITEEQAKPSNPKAVETFKADEPVKSEPESIRL